MIVFTKEPTSPEVVKYFKERGETLIEVTMKRLYVLSAGDGNCIEDVLKDWFITYKGRSHAYRDGSLIGNSDDVIEIRNLTDDGKEIVIK